MDLRLDRSRAKEGFAQADHSLVRMDMDPQQVRELAEPDRFEGCDLQWRFPDGSADQHPCWSSSVTEEHDHARSSAIFRSGLSTHALE